ncbi:MAG: hypothetical protein ACYDAZ_00760 [Thermoplasmataceae archaeon]
MKSIWRYTYLAYFGVMILAYVVLPRIDPGLSQYFFFLPFIFFFPFFRLGRNRNSNTKNAEATPAVDNPDYFMTIPANENRYTRLGLVALTAATVVSATMILFYLGIL